MSDKKVYTCFFGGLQDRIVSINLGYARKEVDSYRNYFKTNFINKVKKDKDHYYMFIVTDQQMEEFNSHLKKYNMYDCIVAKREGARNQNYRWRNHPKLNWFIFNFPETFTVKE